MIYRKEYIDRIIEFANKPFIKVITGIRRSGKSTILKQIQREIKKNGIKEDQIIYLNFESFRHSEIKDAKSLYEYIDAKITKKTRYYLFFDEIQEVKDWEKAINSFNVDFDTDIYLTGSNSHLLSSELATYLSGRYIQFTVYPLSFKEYLSFREKYAIEGASDIYADFQHFLQYGSFPVIHSNNYSIEQAYSIVYDIYTSVILRDVVQRYKIRDIELLERVIKFIFNNIGHNFSAKKISDYFKNQNRKLDINTIYNYLNALESSYIIYKVNRYNIRGKEILKTNEKYFIGDTSLLYVTMGYKNQFISGMLENIVFMELKIRGYKIFIGKYDSLEIDFVAEKKGKKIYIQVAYKMTEKQTIEREHKPLLRIKDNYPKYVITMDDLLTDNIDGIEHYHIADFLLKEF